VPGSVVVVIDNGLGAGGGGGGAVVVVVVGAVIVNVRVLDVPPLRPEVYTVTLAVPVFATYVDETVAFN